MATRAETKALARKVHAELQRNPDQTVQEVCDRFGMWPDTYRRHKKNFNAESTALVEAPKPKRAKPTIIPEEMRQPAVLAVPQSQGLPTLPSTNGHAIVVIVPTQDLMSIVGRFFH